MSITAEEMHNIVLFHCPWCAATFTADTKDCSPVNIRDTEIDVLAVCPRCGAICGTTVENKENTK